MLRYLLMISALMAICARGQEAGHCIMYDSCGWDLDYGHDGGNDGLHFLNCFYDGPAKTATDDMLEILKDVCPHLYNDGEVNGT